MKKEKLLDKIVKKDYNDELEKILSKKQYKGEVKNLLLDILYKVEDSYKDYEEVKRNVLPKEEYMENIINTIQNKCDDIQFVKMENNPEAKKTTIVNKDKKEIICYPMARKLLYAISRIQKSSDIVRSDDWLINQSVTHILNIGNNVNTVEPLRDFNGFSWKTSVLEMESVFCNLIYQDFIILVGNKLLEEWVNKNDPLVDYTELIIEELENLYGKRNAHVVIELLKRIAIGLELAANKDVMEQAKKEKNEIELKLNETKNVEKYLEDFSVGRKKLLKEIKDIDIMLNDKQLLQKEYIKRNQVLPLEKKIFSLRIFEKNLREEREELLEKMKICNNLMHVNNFLESQNNLQRKLNVLNLTEKEDIGETTYKNIILLQRQVIRCLKTKVEKTKEKSDLIKLIYEIRYFNLLPVKGDRKIEDIDELNKAMKELKQDVSKKAIKLGCITEIAKEEKLNEKIMVNIFSLETISLENTHVRVAKKPDGGYVQFFDEDMLEKEIRIISRIRQNDLNIKLNRITRLFAK